MVSVGLIKGVQLKRELAIDIILCLYKQAGLQQPDPDDDDFYLEDAFNEVSPTLKLVDNGNDIVVIGYSSSYGNGCSNYMSEVGEHDIDASDADFYTQLDKLGIRQSLLCPQGQQSLRLFIYVAG